MELPRPIPQNSLEPDHGCTSKVYFDNADDNVALMLYNVALMLYNVTLMSRNHVNTITSVIAAKQTA